MAHLVFQYSESIFSSHLLLPLLHRTNLHVGDVSTLAPQSLGSSVLYFHSPAVHPHDPMFVILKHTQTTASIISILHSTPPPTQQFFKRKSPLKYPIYWHCRIFCAFIYSTWISTEHLYNHSLELYFLQHLLS